ncbi:hypothetical protein NM208_g1962 [Fusarium decemcellulare]|uniref:Uncharacterized protein n=1 Tax=Fusarium decemcellulare TaxID=57161 RepID=A0ACC1SUI4_9HYPO|nr:hypothetical protein NM208_g1962 [Fusarium decemcellulare]
MDSSNSASLSQAGDWYQPAETTPHQCTLMAYPNTTCVTQGDLLKAAQKEIIAIANAIAEFEPVVLFSSSDTLDEVKSQVVQGVAAVHADETSHLWMRDLGPIFVKSRDGKAVRGINFNFNYWGNKRGPSGDERMAAIAAKHITGVQPISTTLIAEGGGMDVDGEGTFMAAESAVLNDNRNPGKSKAQIEAELSRLLGAKKFIWMSGEVDKDTTDCHVDALARFVGGGKVVLSKPSPKNPGRYVSAYEDARAKLTGATDAQGRLIEMYDCVEPDSGKLENVVDGDIIASYVNFLPLNGGLILPKFGDEQRDAEALGLFQKLYPDQKVVQVYINALPIIGGGIHCATQQVPAAD